MKYKVCPHCAYKRKYNEDLFNIPEDTPTYCSECGHVTIHKIYEYYLNMSKSNVSTQTAPKKSPWDSRLCPSTIH